MTEQEMCGFTASACTCKLPKHDLTVAHECSDEVNCDGSWLSAVDGEIDEVARFPKCTQWEMMGALLQLAASKGIRRGGIRFPVPGEEEK